MITSRPRDSAVRANSEASAGVRCADITRHSWATPKRSSVWDVARIVSQSDLLRMTTPTRDFEFGIADFGFFDRCFTILRALNLHAESAMSSIVHQPTQA